MQCDSECAAGARGMGAVGHAAAAGEASRTPVCSCSAPVASVSAGLRGKTRCSASCSSWCPWWSTLAARAGSRCQHADKGAGNKGSPGSRCRRWSAKLRCENRVLNAPRGGQCTLRTELATGLGGSGNSRRSALGALPGSDRLFLLRRAEECHRSGSLQAGKGCPERQWIPHRWSPAGVDEVQGL